MVPILVILELRRLRQEDRKFEGSLGYNEPLSQTNKTNVITFTLNSASDTIRALVLAALSQGNQSNSPLSFLRNKDTHEPSFSTEKPQSLNAHS